VVERVSGSATSPRGPVVEFFGLPGVGKSATCVRVGRKLAELGIESSLPSFDLAHGMGRGARMARKSLVVAGELALHAGSARRALRAVLPLRGAQPALAFSKLAFNWLLVVGLAREARRDPRRATLLDEGPFQGLWSLGLEGDLAATLALVARLEDLVALPDCLVVGQARPATVEERLRARPRGESRLDDRLEDEPRLLGRGIEVFQRLRDEIERRLAERVQLVSITSETEADVERNAARLTELIQGRMRAAPVAGPRA
jgi:hypothetical protein